MDTATQFPFNGDFTGYNEIKANLIEKFQELTRGSGGSLSAKEYPVDFLDGVKHALMDSLKLPSKLREQILKAFLEQLGEPGSTEAPRNRRESEKYSHGLSPQTKLSPYAKELAQFLQEKLLPTGFRSQVLTQALGIQTIEKRSRPRWAALDFKSVPAALPRKSR